MTRITNSQRGFSHILTLGSILVLTVAATIGFMVVRHQKAEDALRTKKASSITSFETCRLDRSNTIIQSTPQKCVTANGTVFAEEIK